MIDQLPGIGPKMAYIVEDVAFHIYIPVLALTIDIHMHCKFNQ
jgi:endonuclease III